MSSTTPSSNFRLVLDALESYAKKTGIDLREKAFADELLRCDSPDSILQLLQEGAEGFKRYRDGNRELIKLLTPIVHVLHPLSAIIGEIGMVSIGGPNFLILLDLPFHLQEFPPVRAVFASVNILLNVRNFIHSTVRILVISSYVRPLAGSVRAMTPS